MAYFGNKDSPRESGILERMGPSFFGCSAAVLEEDVSFARWSEQRADVLPVHVDANGRPCVVFSSPVAGRTQTFYLEDHAIVLAGEVSTFTEGERVRWLRRRRDLSELRRCFDCST